jgi:NAD(P)-dependent dehydrogenase (short-subunit alcohol dehydrogenase family)
VETTLREFGRIDAMVNNAGNMIWASLPELDLATFDAILDVHVRGSFNAIRAAWPHMVEQGYGRIVLTTSIGMLGMPDNLPSATAKAAMLGMANSLTASAVAAKVDLRVNTIAPNAITRLAGKPKKGGENRGFGEVPEMDPAAVAPMAAYLAHEACQVSGEVYSAGAGRFGRLFLAQGPGWAADDATGVTVDDVAAHWEQINAEDGYYVPASPVDWSRRFMAHLFPKG